MKNSSLDSLAFRLIGALIAQYLLGMAVNLFVQFPQDQKGGQLWVFAWHQIPLALHILIGTFLLIGSLVLLGQANRIKSSTWKRAASYGFIGILLAWLGGISFIPTQIAAYSYLMSMGFLGALLAYGWGISASRQSRENSQS